MDARVETGGGKAVTLEKGAAGWFLAIEKDGQELACAGLDREDRKRLIAALVESL